MELTTEVTKDIRRDTLEKLEIYFSMKIGTYTKDDVMKVSDVFALLNEITYKLAGELDLK